LDHLLFSRSFCLSPVCPLANPWLYRVWVCRKELYPGRCCCWNCVLGYDCYRRPPDFPWIDWTFVFSLTERI
jgi:hypothetical protein